VKEWLRETHGPGFELLRHFLLRFFDSDLVTESGQTRTTLIWSFSIVGPWFLMLGSSLFSKYRHFSSLASPEPYRLAVKADELWLVMLMMSTIGLLAAIKWQALFPGLRDYRALGSLPLRTRQIFTAKFAALLLVTTAAIVTLVAIPSVMFPIASHGRWVFDPSLGGRMLAHATASVAGCYFFFFATVALQGVLLNLLPPRAFGRIGGTVQGLAVAAMLILIVLSFCIGPPQMKTLLAAPAAEWFPPLWFVGLYQTLMGDPDPLMQALASHGLLGLRIAIAVALVSYLASYRRHRAWMVEGGSAGSSRDRRWKGALLDRLIASPRQQAVMVFLWTTLLRSSHHRMILMGYAGVAIAIIAAGLMGINTMLSSERALVAGFVWVHGITLLFLLVGLRHLFSIPTELRANWTFQITEAEGRDEWLDAVDRFVLWAGAALVLLLPFPFEAAVVGWRSLGALALFVAIGLLLYEWMFQEWRKLPFTCSQLPGKTPLWILVLYLFGLSVAVPLANAILSAALFSGAGYTFILVMTAVAWRRVHAARREMWGELRLKYDEVADPAIHGLGLGK
jgi:hypothetical protein